MTQTKTATEVTELDIPLEQLILIEDPAHPLYDPTVKNKLNEEKVAELQRDGIKQNILVTPDGKGKYLIVFGNDRFRIARELGIPSLRARVEHFDLETDEGAAEAVRIRATENIHRKEVSMFWKADMLKRYLQLNHSLELVAEGEDKVCAPSYKLSKAAQEDAKQFLGVISRGGLENHLLLWKASPFLRSKAEKLGDSTCVEIIRKYPLDWPKQDKAARGALAAGVGSTGSKSVVAGKVGERAVKAKELKELAFSAWLSSKITVPVKDFASFLAGEMKEEEREKFMNKHSWVEEWITPTEHEVGEEGGEE